MDAINTSHGPSQADLLVQQNVQQAPAPAPQPQHTATEETGETAPEPVEAPESNLGNNVNTYA